MTRALFSPGSLIRARGREWIDFVGSDVDNLRWPHAWLLGWRDICRRTDRRR